MVPQQLQQFQYGAAVQLIVQFIDPVATEAANGTPVPLNIAGATDLIVGLLFPDSVTSQNFAASFLTDGSDGQIYYNTLYNTDLVQLGTFQIQGKATLGGHPILTALGFFQVVQNVDNAD